MRYRRLPAGAGTAVEICITDRHDGDFRIDGPADELAERRGHVFDGEWTWLRQVHGADVAVVVIGEEPYARLVDFITAREAAAPKGTSVFLPHPEVRRRSAEN